MSWWRAYDESVDDPKLQRMPGELFKAWYNIMCLTSRHGGKLPHIADIAFSLRKPSSQVEKIIADLRERGLVDETDGTLHPHNWNGRQFKSDVSTDRVKEFRKRKGNDPPTVSGNVSSTVSGTPPEQSRAESEQKDAATAANGLFPDPDADYYRRAREVLGKNAGGLAARLKAAKNGNLALARAAIETASTKHDAREYIGRIVAGQDDESAQWPSGIPGVT